MRRQCCLGLRFTTMERSPKLKVGVALIAGTGILLSTTSCSSPTQATWQKIRSEGLVTVLWDIHRQQLVVPENEQLMVAASGSSKKSANRDSRARAPKNTSDLKKAILVPGKAGYVRTPYTSPARLVDVRGFKAGTQVRCPYSREIFIVPDKAIAKAGVSKLLSKLSVKSTASTRRDSNPPRVPVKTSRPAPKKQISKVTPRSPSSSASPSKKIVANTGVGAGRQASSSQKSPKPQPKKQAPTPEPKKVAATKTRPKEKGSPVAKTKAQTVNKTPPFGLRISGKPGFVYSPFAEKHQLVNVEGLTPGIAVRCPYSGKIFRVPDEMAQVVAAPEAPTPPTKTITGPSEADVPSGSAEAAAVGSPKKRGNQKPKSSE